LSVAVVNAQLLYAAPESPDVHHQRRWADLFSDGVSASTAISIEVLEKVVVNLPPKLQELVTWACLHGQPLHGLVKSLLHGQCTSTLQALSLGDVRLYFTC
jgi:hypothetical protein